MSFCFGQGKVADRTFTNVLLALAAWKEVQAERKCRPAQQPCDPACKRPCPSRVDRFKEELRKSYCPEKLLAKEIAYLLSNILDDDAKLILTMQRGKNSCKGGKGKRPDVKACGLMNIAHAIIDLTAPVCDIAPSAANYRVDANAALFYTLRGFLCGKRQYNSHHEKVEREFPASPSKYAKYDRDDDCDTFGGDDEEDEGYGYDDDWEDDDDYEPEKKRRHGDKKSKKNKKNAVWSSKSYRKTFGGHYDDSSSCDDDSKSWCEPFGTICGTLGTFGTCFNTSCDPCCYSCPSCSSDSSSCSCGTCSETSSCSTFSSSCSSSSSGPCPPPRRGMQCFRANACVVLDCANPCTGKFKLLRVTVCNLEIGGRPVRKPHIPSYGKHHYEEDEDEEFYLASGGPTFHSTAPQGLTYDEHSCTGF